MKYCIMDTSDTQITQALQSYGFICVDVVPSDCVSPPICCHSDVLYKKLDSNTVVVSACQKPNFKLLENIGYKIIVNDRLQPGYRTESWLNYVLTDRYLIYNPKTAEILPDFYIDNKKIIEVNQGYTGCSTICVTDDAFITDDAGIYKSLKKENIDCLLIEKGNIRLDGYDYGFIGGASVKISNSEILFFGDFSDKSEKGKITEFLSKYNVSALFIENKPLTDIGSAIIL